VANYDLGTAHGKVQIDYDSGPLKKTSDDLDKVKSKGQSTGQAFDKVGTGLGRTGILVAAGIGLAVKSAADFEKSVSAIGAVTGATGDQLQQVRDKALQLGRDTKFSASEAADAMGELAKAGVALPDIMNGAADATVALAAAGGVALPEAANIASNAMNQFALKAKDLPAVADLIAGAANASAIDVSDFGQSIAQVGAVAHSAGLSFKDTATAIAVMGNAGIKGSDAGTSLKQMLISLANPTKKSADLMKQLGFSAFDAQGNLKPLDQIAGGLQTSMQNLSPQARNAALAIIFGSDAARAGAVFFQNGATGVDKMSAALTKVKAADVAKARMDNLSGSVEQLRGSIETAAIKFGEMGQGPLKSLVDGLTGLINGFTNLSGATQQTILVLIASIGGLALFGAGLIKTVKFVQELILVLRTLRVIAGVQAVFSALSAGIGILNGSLLTLAANPVVLTIILIVAAVALLTIGIIELWKHSETFRNIVMGVWDAIKSAVSTAGEILSAVFDGIKAGFNGVMVGVRALGTAWSAVWKVFGPIVSVQFAIIKAVISVAIALIKGVITSAMAVIKTAWNVWLFFAPIVQSVWNLIMAIVNLGIAAIKLAITIVLVVLYQTWKTFWAGLSVIVSAAWAVIQAIVRVAVGIVKGIFTGAAAAWRAIVHGVMTAIHALINSWLGQKVIGVIKAAIAKAKSIFNGLASLAKTVGGFFSKVYSAIKGPVDKALNLLKGIGGKVIGYFKNAGKWLVQAGRNIIQGLINGITSMINRVTGLLNTLTKKIKQAKGPESKDKVLLVSNAELIMDGLMKGFQKKIPEVEAMLRKIGPGNIATSIARSETINAAVGATAGNAAGARTVSRTVPAAGRSTATLDHDALVRALKDAGLGDKDIFLDGEKISRTVDRNSGRRTSTRRRTQ
jgi:TP901 family phage tail tape measure protein